MIGLRVLHLIRDLDTSPACEQALALARWSREQPEGQAQEVAVVVADPPAECSSGIDGVPVIGYANGRVGWWMGGRAEFVRRVAAWTPDLVHVHRLDALPVAIELARRLGLPVVVTVSDEVDGHAARNLRADQVTWILAPTEHLRAHLVGQLALARDRVAILPMGVATGALSALRRSCEGGEERSGDAMESDGQRKRTVIGIQGPFDAASGLGALLRALPPSTGEETCTVLAACVSADDRQRCLALAEGVGQAGVLCAVTGLGSRDLVARSDVLAHLPLRDRPALAVIEALAAGRPVLASAIGSLPELVRDGEDALLVPHDDAHALSQAIAALTDPARRSALGVAGRAHAATRFDMDVVGRAADAIYRAAIAGPGSDSVRAETGTTYRRVAIDRGGTDAPSAAPPSGVAENDDSRRRSGRRPTVK